MIEEQVLAVELTSESETSEDDSAGWHAVELADTTPVRFRLERAA
jgi:hypothetical protein